MASKKKKSMGTISDWIIEMEKAGLNKLARAFHSKKLKDYERLKKTGLPTFDDFIVPFRQFQKENKNLEEFLSKYKGFVIRAIPNTKELPRRYKIGIHTFEDCQKFLDQNVQKENQDKYSVFLTEHEPTNKSGIIISKRDKLFFEIGECGLDELSHGRDPSISCIIDFTKIGHISDKTQWKIKKNKQNEKLMYNVLRYIEISRDNFNPLFIKGYFEFVKTKKTNRIKFVDYKINKSYLK